MCEKWILKSTRRICDIFLQKICQCFQQTRKWQTKICHKSIVYHFRHLFDKILTNKYLSSIFSVFALYQNIHILLVCEIFGALSWKFWKALDCVGHYTGYMCEKHGWMFIGRIIPQHYIIVNPLKSICKIFLKVLIDRNRCHFSFWLGLRVYSTF